MTCDEDEQCLEKSEYKSPSSDSFNESEPLAVWQKKLRLLAEPDQCTDISEPNNIEIKKLSNDKSPKCPKGTKIERQRLSIDEICFSKEQLEKTNSNDEQEIKAEIPQSIKIQKTKVGNPVFVEDIFCNYIFSTQKECESKWRIERPSSLQFLGRQTVDAKQQNSKKGSNAKQKFPNLDKEKIILKISKVQPPDHTKQPIVVKSSKNQVNRVTTRRQQSCQDQQCQKSKLKRAKRQSQSKHEIVVCACLELLHPNNFILLPQISANSEEAHKSPSAINLKVDSVIAPSAPTSNCNPTDDAENLSVERLRSSEEQKVDVVIDSHDEHNEANDSCENLINPDKLVDIFSEPDYELDDMLIDEAILSINNSNNNDTELTTMIDVVDDNETVTECVEEIDNYMQSFTGKTPIEIDQELVKSTEFFNKLSSSTTNIKTPLELDAIMQDTLNYDEDDADIISVATSWDGDDESTFDFLPPEKVKDTPTKPSKELEKEPQKKPEFQSNLSELRSFRIPKKSVKIAVSTEAKMAAGNVQKEDQNPPRQIEWKISQKCKQPQQQNQPATIANIRRSLSETVVNSIGQPAPVFAPPYRVPAESTEVSSITPIIFGNNDFKATIFGIKCWQFLDGRCRKNNCNHMLNSISMVLRQLNQMNKLQLCCMYKFVLRHGILFKTYFVEFAYVFGNRLMHKHLVKMIEDCGLYKSLSAPFLNDLFYVLLRYQISPEVATGHFMKHLWKPNNSVMCSDLSRQLLRILSKADWYNYMENLEQLFYGEKFPIPGDFLTSIARDAVTKNQPMLISKAWELVLFNPIDGNADTLSSVIEILKSSGVPQLQPIQIQPIQQHILLQQHQPVQLHRQQPLQQHQIQLQPRQQQLQLQQRK